MWVVVGLVGAMPGLGACHFYAGDGSDDAGGPLLDAASAVADADWCALAAETCGDGCVTGDETCDTAIPAGQSGVCPSPASCPAPTDCTTVSLVGENTCFAECRVEEVIELVNGDGCCPPSADAWTDSDCGSCGDGVLDLGEDCDDGDTVDGDGCDGACQCEPGVCGDGLVSCGESCDDGATTPGDGCDELCRLEAAGYMITELYLRDPHMFALIADILCIDITDMPLDQCGFNCVLNGGIGLDGDGDGDGYVDLGFALVFRPLEQVDPTTVDVVTEANCTVPPGTVCTTGPDTSVTPKAVTSEVPGGADCLEPLPDTLHMPPYSPPVLSTPAPCFVTAGGPLSLTLAGFGLPFSDARVAAVWLGDPATRLVTGLIRGFLPEVAANEIILPDSIDFIGGKPFSEILLGGTNNCSCDHGEFPPGCESDLDVGPDGVTPGWYLYFQFEAERVEWM